MREKLIEKIVCRDRSKEEFLRYSSYSCHSLDIFSEPVTGVLSSIRPSLGACVMMSAGLVSVLECHYSIPAIAVLGDLKIDGSYIFKCGGNVPKGNSEKKIIAQNWDGHCWVEVDSIILDLSIFRTAYKIKHPSLLKDYLISKFGTGRGAFVSPVESLPQELEFIPKFVLNDNQLREVLAGLSAQQGRKA